MENLKHTKGEWILTKNSCYFDVETNLDKNTPKLVVNVLMYKLSEDNIIISDSHCEEAEANAKLIASAPELLEALIMLMHPNDMNDFNFANRAREKAKNAINKATK